MAKLTRETIKKAKHKLNEQTTDSFTYELVTKALSEAEKNISKAQ